MATKKKNHYRKDQVFVGAYFPQEAYDRSKKAATSLERSMSAFVRIACAKLAREIEEKKR